MAFDIKEMVKSKDALRRKLAERPISEKLRMVEDLSERTLALRPDTSALPPEAPWTIPPHWKWKKMADVATVVGGSTPATDHKEYFGGDIPWITPADLSKYTDKTISRGARNITQEGLSNSGARLLPAGAVLFSSRAPIGYVAIAANPVATNQGFKSFILGDEVTPAFVYYYLQRARSLISSLASGTTFLEISGKKAAQIPIPIPPLEEQCEIVLEIEKQFTRLEAGVTAFRRVQANLKRYRAAVLKAACEGKLVPTEAELAKAEVRKKKAEIEKRNSDSTSSFIPHPSSLYESGEQLLKRILAERHQKWTGRGRYQEPRSPDTANLPRLPEGWTWVTVEQLLRDDSGLSYGILKPGVEEPRGVPMVRVMDIADGRMSGTEIVKVSPKLSQEFRRTVLEKGDILLAVMATVGRCTVVPEYLIGANVNRALAVIKATPLALTDFLALAIRSPRLQQLFQKNKIGSAQARINLGELRTYVLPLPPLTEQARIVAEVERRLTVVEDLEALVAANQRRSINLRQAILHTSFHARSP